MNLCVYYDKKATHCRCSLTVSSTPLSHQLGPIMVTAQMIFMCRTPRAQSYPGTASQAITQYSAKIHDDYGQCSSPPPPPPPPPSPQHKQGQSRSRVWVGAGLGFGLGVDTWVDTSPETCIDPKNQSDFVPLKGIDGSCRFRPPTQYHEVAFTGCPALCCPGVSLPLNCFAVCSVNSSRACAVKHWVVH